LSNIDDSIEEVLELKTYSAASLLAEYDDSKLFREFGAFNDRTIIHNSIFEERPEGISNLVVIPAIKEIGFSQIGTSEVGTLQISSSQISSSQISSSQVGIEQVSPGEISSGEIGPNQLGIAQIGSTQIGFAQVGPIQSNLHQISFGQIGSTQVNTSEVHSSEVDFSQINSSKFTITNSVLASQFFQVHKFSPQDIVDHTSVSFWTEFLTGTTPFNLNIEIIDLPTGQLAVACWRQP
jgi:hypothetical protein